MTVTIDGTLYLVSWKHDQPNRSTTCRIAVLRTGCQPRSVQASTRVHPKDQYIKEVGRKWSLLAAVQLLLLDKPGRTAILKGYFDRKINPPVPRVDKTPRCSNCESNPAEADCARCAAAICSGCRDTDGCCPFCSQQ